MFKINKGVKQTEIQKRIEREIADAQRHLLTYEAEEETARHGAALCRERIKRLENKMYGITSPKLDVDLMELQNVLNVAKSA